MLRGRAPKPVSFSDNRVSDNRVSDNRASDDRTADVPRYPGPLATTLGTAPVFRSVVRGYDRDQVDSYVAWVEDELLTERRAIREVVGQFRQSVGELERSRRLPVRSREAQQLLDVSASAERVLATAADEAAALVTAAMAEADRVVTEAHREAGARLERVRLLRQRVTAWCQGERKRIEAERAEARQVVAAAHAEAEALLAEARRQRAEEDRAAEQARARADEEAAARLAAANRELDGLHRQWRDVVTWLRSTDGLVARALTLLDREPEGARPPSEPPVQQLPRSA